MNINFVPEDFSGEYVGENKDCALYKVIRRLDLFPNQEVSVSGFGRIIVGEKGKTTT